MIHGSVSSRAGVTLSDLESLFNGRAYASVSKKMNVPMGHIENFINHGSASADLANCLGFDMLAVEDLGSRLGKEGRIGLVIGVLISS
jgi:hypothetical protein